MDFAYLITLGSLLSPLSLQDLDYLEIIWDLMQEWQCSWEGWKVITFGSLDTEGMGHQAQVLLKRLNKVAREVKVRDFSFS